MKTLKEQKLVRCEVKEAIILHITLLRQAENAGRRRLRPAFSIHERITF
jgi:hypothetical protein